MNDIDAMRELDDARQIDQYWGEPDDSDDYQKQSEERQLSEEEEMAIMRGLEDAKNGRIKSLGSFSVGEK